MFGDGAKRICGVVAAETASQLMKLLRLGERETGTVELRLDWLRNDEERKKFLILLRARKRSSGTTFIATCRRRVGGGEFQGVVEAELHWLRKAREAGCQWCDLELESLLELPEKSLRGYALPGKVLLSLHDFKRTPKLPKKMSVPAAEFDAIKIAAVANSIADSVRLLKLAGRSGRVVPVPMGEIGLPARILALRAGSPLAYAPVAVATAPGQVSLRELKYLYRAHELGKNSRVYGVIGNPIGHSLSPLMHNTGYIVAKKDAVFLPFLVERLGDFLKAIPNFGVRGFAVTLPHKETVFRKLDACEPLAQKIGAVNTVTVRRDGSLHGSNTDYLGVLRALQKKINLSGRSVLILGAGGAARAAALAVASAGAEVFVCARREGMARALAKAVNGERMKRAALQKKKFDVIVNATPLGMHPYKGISPLAASELNCSLVFDMIYRPIHTKLLEMALARGLATISGVEMFLAQGIAQWEWWMKEEAPEKEMRRVVLKELIRN